ncbi:hypothetical protein LSCM1_06360 [Leishmania martiniquensis]|uniref:Uncharacterized protein n=1 Tax=Leishmania martiniquensis TaxID=1580590 RepID=A0A836H5K6_9TRYP|nr:hypothetical protein LSCM1_06360 [Leishmania martiniquensis]
MSAPSSSYREYRQALIELYEKYDPAKVSRVDGLLHQFAGHEEALVKAVERKFCEGADPTAALASASHVAASPQPPVTREDTDFVGPPLDAPPTAATPASKYDAAPFSTAGQPPAVPPDPNGANSSEAACRGNSGTRPLRSHETHAPLQASRNFHEPTESQGLEEPYLHTLAKKQEEQSAEAAEDSAVEAAMPATPPHGKTNLRGDHEAHTSDSAGYEESEARTLRMSHSSAPGRAPQAERQRQRYLGREEGAAEETMPKCGPESAPRIVNTETTSPFVAAEPREGTKTAAAKDADVLQANYRSAPLVLQAAPQEAEKAAKSSMEGVAAPASVAAAPTNQADGAVRAEEEADAPQCEGVEAASTPAASRRVEAAAVLARITRHEGSAVDAAAVSASAVLLSSGDSRPASSPPAKGAAVTSLTSSIPAPVAMARPLPVVSARKPERGTRVSRACRVALPVCRGVVAPSLILAEDEIDAALNSAIRRTALFDVTFYDFFRVLGSSYHHGHERVSRLVADTLFGALFPELSPAKVRWETAGASRAGEEEAGVSDEEMRECIVRATARQLRSSATVSDVRAAQSAQSLVRCMADFVTTCRMAVLQLQRQSCPLFVGFWVHCSVLPRAVPHWKRRWAMTSSEGDAVSVCHIGSLRPELRIPFWSVARCYREMHAAHAPPAYTRNGLAFQLTTGAPPLLVVVCPESGDVTAELLSAFRSWSGSQSPAPKRAVNGLVASSSTVASHAEMVALEGATQLSANGTRVWVLERTTLTYEAQRWSVEELSICMVSDRTRELHTCAVAGVESVIAEVELPVTPPVRSTHGFVLCFGKGSAPLMAFTEQRQERTRLLDRLYRSRVLTQIAAGEEGIRGGGI